MSENNCNKLYEEANELYREKKFTEAVKLYKEAAELGSVEATYMLGICYNYNLGVDEPDESVREIGRAHV